MTESRRTLADDIVLEGVGIHRGESVRMRVGPSPSGSGIVFRHSGEDIPAVAGNADVTARNTTLAKNGVCIFTVEHILSALAGMGVDDALVELTAPEPPIMDGSSLPLADAIRKVGLRDNGGSVEPIRIRAPLHFYEEHGGVFALPFEGFRVSFFVFYTHALIGAQWYDLEVTPHNYLNDVAPARTYGFEEELKALFDAGLAAGGSLENAVLIYADRFSSPLRFSDEMVRHKAMDLIGDLTLAGRPLRGHFIGFRSGHRINFQFVKHLLDVESKSL